MFCQLFAVDVCSCHTLITHLVRCELHSSVNVNQLEGHGKVLVAVCCEGALSFGRIVHPACVFTKKKRQKQMKII